MPFSRVLLLSFAALVFQLFHSHALAWEVDPQPLGSLQSYTGILNMPTARIKSDWTLRLKTGYASPYRYYGGAVGFLDRFEFHGQFTVISSKESPFGDQGYGSYKDRSAGMRAVLLKENEFLPQVAMGLFDATGTAFFGSRYLTFSKMIGNVDVTLGLGQGTLAGEYVGGSTNAVDGSAKDTGLDFITSDPLRKTSLFGGAEWHANQRLTLVAEYSSIDRENMMGYRDTDGSVIKEDKSTTHFNIGVKYKISEYIHASAAFLRGDTYAWGIDIEFPLKSEALLVWEKTKPYLPNEKTKWAAYDADNYTLSTLIADALKEQGFQNISVSCTADAVWVEFSNNLHLSNSRAFGHVADVCDRLMPQRISTFFLNIKKDNSVILSLETTRGAFIAFRDHKMDSEGFLAYSEINLYKDENWHEFRQNHPFSKPFHVPEDKFSFRIDPKIETFINNKKGFLKSKGFLRARTEYSPWPGGTLHGELQWTLFNEFDEVDYVALEKENSVRTDLLDYEAESDLRISMLALEQKINLPYSIQGRLAAGAFESAYAGLGAEMFRYFNKGLWGIGLETELVRKRDPDNNFKLRDYPDKWYSTGFLNIYTQILPSQGIDAGLTIGRFLAGDVGFRMDVRRSFDYFTLGAWYTKTNTDLFESPENRGADEKGVYISFPISIFLPHDKPGHLSYSMTSFTKDPGAMVRQPGRLYPMNPWATPDHTKRTIDDMRRY
ncbi:MAG: YjbH domain-containing protein [Desulfobacterium sp.]